MRVRGTRVRGQDPVTKDRGSVRVRTGGRPCKCLAAREVNVATFLSTLTAGDTGWWVCYAVVCQQGPTALNRNPIGAGGVLLPGLRSRGIYRATSFLSNRGGGAGRRWGYIPRAVHRLPVRVIRPRGTSPAGRVRITVPVGRVGLVCAVASVLSLTWRRQQQQQQEEPNPCHTVSQSVSGPVGTKHDVPDLQ